MNSGVVGTFRRAFFYFLEPREFNRVLRKRQRNRLKDFLKVYVHISEVAEVYNSVFGWKIFFAYANTFIGFLAVTNLFTVYILKSLYFGGHTLEFALNILMWTVALLVSFCEFQLNHYFNISL